MAGITTTILDCLKVDGVPIVTWINNLIHNLQVQINALETDLTNLHADVTNIKSQLAALQALVTALQTCCNNIQNYIALSHKPLVLTHNQDVTNRVMLDVGNQLLNLPPPIVARLHRDSVTAPLMQKIPDGGVLTPLSDLTADYSSVPGMISNGRIIIPRTGRYNIVGSWGCNTDETDAAQGYSIGISLDLQNATVPVTQGVGRWQAPIMNMRAETVTLHLPCHHFLQNESLGLLAYTDYPGGVTAYGAWLSVEYIEGS